MSNQIRNICKKVELSVVNSCLLNKVFLEEKAFCRYCYSWHCFAKEVLV